MDTLKALSIVDSRREREPIIIKMEISLRGIEEMGNWMKVSILNINKLLFYLVFKRLMHCLSHKWRNLLR